MAGRKDSSDKTTTKKSTKKSKTPESEVVSNSPINDAVVSDSEESDSFDLSLKSQMHKHSNSTIRSRKGLDSERPTNSINKKPKPEPQPESESDEDQVVADSEEGDVEESAEVEDSEVEESEADEENVNKEVKIEETNGHKKSNQNGNGKRSGNKKGKEIEKSESALYKLPMRRISRIIKSENADLRITHEATFLINKATEKFLELFAKEAYACAFLDRKNQVGYSHLSKVVAKRHRFGFLSDFVPEQVKAEDALAELSMNEK